MTLQPYHNSHPEPAAETTQVSAPDTGGWNYLWFGREAAEAGLFWGKL
jgi:hypothetical protein